MCVCVALVDSVIVGPQSVENAARLVRVSEVANRQHSRRLKCIAITVGKLGVVEKGQFRVDRE